MISYALRYFFNQIRTSFLMERIDVTAVQNPILDREPKISLRDPAVIYHKGVFHLYHTAVEHNWFKYILYLDVSYSRDLINWTIPKRVIKSEAGYSSPGNGFQHEDNTYLTFQTYPVPRFREFASSKARLWIMKAVSVEHDMWEQPYCIKPEGCMADWTRSRRQIDPYIIKHEDVYYCFYKTSGELGLLKSDDLKKWSEASPDKPVLARGELPIRAGIENPCIIKYDSEYWMYFSPTRKGRGIGLAKSTNLMDWYDIEILDFPDLDWAPGGPTAPFVLDLRKETGFWVMFYHGDRKRPHGAALGIAWSKDLLRWSTN